MVASGDVLGAVRLTIHDSAIQLVGYRKPQKEYNPGRAWGMSLFFCGSAGIAFMVVYRFWYAVLPSETFLMLRTDLSRTASNIMGLSILKA